MPPAQVRDLSGRDEPRAPVEDARPHLLLGEAHAGGPLGEPPSRPRRLGATFRLRLIQARALKDSTPTCSTMRPVVMPP